MATLFGARGSLNAGMMLAPTMLCASPRTSLRGQSTNASVTGRITDFSKAVVPNARVIVINTATRIRYETITNETGSYYVTNLAPGAYRIEVEKLGFKAVIKSTAIPARAGRSGSEF